MGLRLVGVDYPGIEGLDELGWLKEIIRACSDPALTITQNGVGASLALPGATTAARGLVLGGDVALYRAAADVLALADTLDLLGSPLRNAAYLEDDSPSPAGAGFIRIGHGAYAVIGMNNAGSSGRQLISWGIAATDVLSIAGDGNLTRFGGHVDINSNEIRNAQLGTDLNPNGYGGFKSAFCFAQDDVAAGQTSVYLKVPGTANGVDITMLFSGSIIGLSVASSENRTAGAATIEPAVAGVPTGLQVYLNAGTPNFARTTAAKDAYPFSAGQNLGVKLTTSADWAPTTADIVVAIVIEH